MGGGGDIFCKANVRWGSLPSVFIKIVTASGGGGRASPADQA